MLVHFDWSLYAPHSQFFKPELFSGKGMRGPFELAKSGMQHTGRKRIHYEQHNKVDLRSKQSKC